MAFCVDVAKISSHQSLPSFSCNHKKKKKRKELEKQRKGLQKEKGKKKTVKYDEKNKFLQSLKK